MKWGDGVSNRVGAWWARISPRGRARAEQGKRDAFVADSERQAREDSDRLRLATAMAVFPNGVADFGIVEELRARSPELLDTLFPKKAPEWYLSQSPLPPAADTTWAKVWSGKTPLMVAVERWNFDAVNALLATRLCDANAKNAAGDTALSRVVKNGCSIGGMFEAIPDKSRNLLAGLVAASNEETKRAVLDALLNTTTSLVQSQSSVPTGHWVCLDELCLFGTDRDRERAKREVYIACGGDSRKVANFLPALWARLEANALGDAVFGNQKEAGSEPSAAVHGAEKERAGSDPQPTARRAGRRL